MRVSICVLTFRRPEGLRSLLRGLDGLVFRAGPEPDAEVVVVDNDAAGSAEAVCEEARAWLRWPLRYEREARPGISFARNRAVASVRPGTDAVAFIDDDEVPEPVWLDELLRVQREHAADVVLGPTLRRFHGEVPRWVSQGGFFADRRMPTGTRLEHGGIGNSLILTRVFGGDPEPFDPRLALAGGEDTLLFLRAARAGRRIVWADEAVVYEWQPASRATARWILRRGYRVANTWSWCERELQSSAGLTAVRVAKALGRFGMGLAMLPTAIFRGRAALVRGLWYLAYGAGNLTGLLRVRFQEYRPPGGR